MKKFMPWIWGLFLLVGLLIFGQGIGYIFGTSKESRVDLLYMIVGAQVALLAAYFSQKK